jgi:hypothetical protein
MLIWIRIRSLAFTLPLIPTSFCQQGPHYFHPSGIPGTISDVQVFPVSALAPLPENFSPSDIDLQKMAAWSLRYLNRSPRPDLNYEPVFFVRPMNVPPAPEGHDSDRAGRHGRQNGLGVSEHARHPRLSRNR